jgi:hypothetical protein
MSWGGYGNFFRASNSTELVSKPFRNSSDFPRDDISFSGNCKSENFFY